MDFIVRSEKETIATAERLAAILQEGDVIFLTGDLGAGKTVFARALIRGLCDDKEITVPSPTFTLLQTYESTKGVISHFDLYRIKDEQEIYELGWEDALANGIMLVEWPERLNDLAPETRLDIVFETSLNNLERRAVSFVPHGPKNGKAWKERLETSDF